MPHTHYTRTARWLHWSMAILFVVVWALGFYSSEWLAGAPHSSKGLYIGLHKNLATPLLLLLVVRVFWRYTHPVPALPADMGANMQRMAHFGHLLLYVLLLAMPLSGCVYAWSGGHNVSVLYWFDLPNPIGKHAATNAIAKAVHLNLGLAAGVVVAGHVLFALKHHFIDRDRVLLNMLGKK